MRYEQKELSITLETEQEIRDFWNIIAFALDWQAYAEKNQKSRMTEDELKLANFLYDLTTHKY